MCAAGAYRCGTGGVSGGDNLTGINISLLAVGCGYSSGVYYPFTWGVAQRSAGLPLFSSIDLRLLTFFLFCLALAIFLVRCAKKTKKPAPGSAAAPLFSASGRWNGACGPSSAH